MKKKWLSIPEYYLIIVALLGGYSPPFHFNPIVLIILFLLVIQVVFKNRYTGMSIATLFFFGNLYFLGAVLSEFNEFSVFTSKAQQLLFIGLGIFSINLVMSLTLLYKYFKVTSTLHKGISQV